MARVFTPDKSIGITPDRITNGVRCEDPSLEERYRVGVQLSARVRVRVRVKVRVRGGDWG